MKKEIERVKQLHEKMHFAENGGEDMLYRMALISEEVGEIAECLTKNRGNIVEEHADLIILILGNCIALKADNEIEQVLNNKLDRLMAMHPTTDGVHTRIITKDNK